MGAFFVLIWTFHFFKTRYRFGRSSYKEATGYRHEQAQLYCSTSTGTYKDRTIYHKLQTPTQINRETITAARDRLIELLDLALSNGHRSLHSAPNILELETFTPSTLKAFILSTSKDVDAAWLLYLQRRKSGGTRELLLTREHAEHWLECAAPVKLIDGAWLARIHHKKTPIELRPVTRIAWQILSEEMGDGELEKNHVHLYSDLLRSFGSSLPPGDSADFVDEKTNPYDDGSVWASAVAQLALGLFPDEFLPEIMGFNLAYEIVAFDTLVAAYELKELDLDPSYFNLHITIDNSDSGHTAMALDCILKLLATSQPPMAENVWRGVQAGFLLATQVRSMPKVPSAIDRTLLELFSRKMEAGNTAHQSCRAKIGGARGMSISAWMHDQGWEKRKYRFLEELAQSSWVVPGQPNRSRLFEELGWKGRMFGAFTVKERNTLAEWIRNLEPSGNQIKETVSWKDFAGRSPKNDPVSSMIGYLHFSDQMKTRMVALGSVSLDGPISHRKLSALLLYSLIPFENACAYPGKAASANMMRALRILRLLNGFSASIPDAVDGMDEVHMPSKFSIFDILTGIEGVEKMNAEFVRLSKLWQWLEGAAQDADTNFHLLLGSQYCFITNLYSNRNMLQISCIEHGLMDSLNRVGRKVLLQIFPLQVEEQRQYQLGYSLTLRTLHEASNF